MRKYHFLSARNLFLIGYILTQALCTSLMPHSNTNGRGTSMQLGSALPETNRYLVHLFETLRAFRIEMVVVFEP